jgi:hypothetical protein
MTDCIFEAINSNMQAYISALAGRQCPSISHDPFIDRKVVLIFRADEVGVQKQSNRVSVNPNGGFDRGFGAGSGLLFELCA